MGKKQLGRLFLCFLMHLSSRTNGIVLWKNLWKEKGSKLNRWYFLLTWAEADFLNVSSNHSLQQAY